MRFNNFFVVNVLVMVFLVGSCFCVNANAQAFNRAIVQTEDCRTDQLYCDLFPVGSIDCSCNFSGSGLKIIYEQVTFVDGSFKPLYKLRGTAESDRYQKNPFELIDSNIPQLLKMPTFDLISRDNGIQTEMTFENKNANRSNGWLARFGWFF